MRLVQVAKILGMTGQQLRKELTEVNFGVKPTDREVPDNMAMGIIRFVAKKHGIDVDFDNIEGMAGEHDETSTPHADTEMPESQEEAEEKESPQEASKKPLPSAKDPSNLRVLRKLTLEDVPEEAIAQQKQVLKKEPAHAGASVATPKRTSRPVKRVEESHQQQIKKKVGTVALPAQISVKEFAEKTGVQIPKVIQSLMKNGVLATINQQIDFDTAAIVASELGVEVQKEEKIVSVEALLKQDLKQIIKDEPESLRPRAPIVTVMGHVDHGKTAILDAIRSADVVSGEAGGITQHIGAYQVEHEGNPVTFIDTPGHEAFTAMRARGAQLTDIAILVVAADEGVKPTTVEAIAHAKDAEVPILVAINKIDRENADAEKVKGELAGYGLQSQDWGGSVPMIPCSAVTKKGIGDLLDAVLVMADEMGLKANPDRPAVATVIESHLSGAHGPVATVVVNTGTLRIGDIVVSGETSGRVKVLMDAHGDQLKEASPSAPARMSGLDGVASVGDIMQVFPSEKHARAFVDAYLESKAREKKHGFADLVSRLSEGKLSQLKIVLKADAQGSLESIQAALQKLSSKEVQPKVIHAAVGAISESDVMMAAASGGIVMGFHVDAPVSVYKTAEREGVEIKTYEIIYKLLEDAELLLSGLVEPVEEEVVTGHLEIRGIFLTKKGEQIVGGKVTDGHIKRLPFRLVRAGEPVATGRITSLKHVEKDIKEAKEGMECGLKVSTQATIQMGDVLEVYTKEFKKAES